jgi:DNA-binding NarL/FixJ family response regulator
VRLYRDGLASFLNAESDIRIVDTAADWRDTRWSPETTADLVLLDAAAADASSAVAAIRDAAPTARVVVLSIDDGESDVIPWAEAGASGFVTREDSLVRLVDVMRSVVRDELPCSPRLASTLLRHVAALAEKQGSPPPRARLTRRELEIIPLLERGFSNKEIGSELCIEVATVKNHLHNILDKLQVRRRAEAVARVNGHWRGAADRAAAR